VDIQRLRNLTTARLHTKMDDIYEDMEYIIGESGIMTHQLPNALDSMLWWLKEHVTDPKFWDDQYDTGHTGDYPLKPMSAEDKQTFWRNFASLPSLLGRGSHHD